MHGLPCERKIDEIFWVNWEWEGTGGEGWEWGIGSSTLTKDRSFCASEGRALWKALGRM